MGDAHGSRVPLRYRATGVRRDVHKACVLRYKVCVWTAVAVAVECGVSGLSLNLHATNHYQIQEAR